MRMVKFGLLMGLTLGLLGLALPSSGEEEKDKPKFTIKEVMKKAHKDGLLNQVASGKADKKDVEELVQLYTALNQNKPPKGEVKDWAMKTEVILKYAKDVAAGKEGAGPKLKEAADCKGCHMAHRPK
jgi:hypothetical protein